MDSNDVNAFDNALADSSSALAKFRARRRKAAIAMAIASFQQGFILGSSVIVGALLHPVQRGGFTTGTTAQFPFTRDPQTYQFNGLYAVASALCVTYWVGSEVLLPVFAKYPTKRRPIMIALICLLPCAFAVGGGAVSASGIQESTVLLYVAFSVLLGFGLSILELFSRLEVLQVKSCEERSADAPITITPLRNSNSFTDPHATLYARRSGTPSTARRARASLSSALHSAPQLCSLPSTPAGSTGTRLLRSLYTRSRV